MQSVSQSAFLQALGYAITNSLWQMALIWIVVVLVSSVFRLSSRTKYSFTLIAQFTGFVWFIITLNFYYQKCNETLSGLPNINYDAPVIIEPSFNNFSSGLLSVIIKAEQLLPYLSVAYLLLVIFLSIRWIRNYHHVQNIRLNGLQKAGIELRLFVKKITAHLNIRHEVKIYISELIKCPMTIGFIKPLILIPVASVNHLSTQQLEAVILHEMAHIKRADYLINIIQSIVELALFFNPFTQLLSKMIREERENSCDDWVLQFQYNPSMYAEALLRIAYLQNTHAFAMHAAAHKNDLLSRVKRMLNQKEKNFYYRNRLFALLLMTGMLTSMAWLHPASKNISQARKPIAKQQLVVEPMAVNVNNPLFNPVYFFSKPLKEEINKVVNSAERKETARAATEIKETFTKVPPVWMDKLQTMQADINDEITVETKEPQVIASIDLPDTAAISASIKLVNEQVVKIEFGKLSKQISKVKDEIVKLSKTKSLADDAQSWNNALNELLNKVNVSEKQNYNLQKVHELLREKIKKEEVSKKNSQQLQKELQKSEELKQKTNLLNHLSAFKAQKEKMEKDAEESKTAQTEISPAYYYDHAYSYTVPATLRSDSNLHAVHQIAEEKPVSISIHADECAVEGYRKVIIAETTDSSGAKHTYRITIELYQ